jgi:hypothetical protein
MINAVKVFRFISLRYANNIIIMKNDKQFVLKMLNRIIMENVWKEEKPHHLHVDNNSF